MDLKTEELKCGDIVFQNTDLKGQNKGQGQGQVD